MTQTTFDHQIAEAESAKAHAIENVERGAPKWVDQAIDMIAALAAIGEPFTTDALWGYLPPPPEPRAMGAAVKRCEVLGYIRPTGRWVLSKRKECHRRPLREWVGVNVVEKVLAEQDGSEAFAE